MKTCLFLLVQFYWEKQMSLQNLETYVVLVSYTLWCFSFYIKEAVSVVPWDFPLVFCFGGGVSLYWGRNSHIVEAALLGYLLLYPILVYLVTCYLFYLSTCLLATCSTWIYMLLYPSLKCPRLLVWRGPLYSYYTMLPHPAVSACLVHCYTLPAQYIYCNRPSSSSHRTTNTLVEG